MNESYQTFLREMRNLAEWGDDIEYNHIQADKILCDLLVSLGYDDIVEEFNNIHKWYS